MFNLYFGAIINSMKNLVIKKNNNNKARVLFLIAVLIIAFAFIVKNNNVNKEPIVISGFYFDTYVSVTIYDDITCQLQSDIIALLSYYDSILSPNNKDSMVSKVNNNEDIYVNEDYISLLTKSIEIADETDGLIDPTILSVYSLYDFEPSNTFNPEPDDISSALDHVDYTKISLDGNKVIKDKKAQIGFGFIAKGYIADRLRDLLLKNNVKNALIDLGGNILVVGDKGNDGYIIGLENPYSNMSSSLLSDYVYDKSTLEYVNYLKEHSSNKLETTVPSDSCINPILTLKLSDASMVTSGIYERYYISDGVIMHHILDTSTGLPVNNELLSVSIIGPDSTLCDAYSTACFLMGTKEGLEFLDTKKEYHGIFITKCNDILYSTDFPYDITFNK